MHWAIEEHLILSEQLASFRFDRRTSGTKVSPDLTHLRVWRLKARAIYITAAFVFRIIGYSTHSYNSTYHSYVRSRTISRSTRARIARAIRRSQAAWSCGITDCLNAIPDSNHIMLTATSSTSKQSKLDSKFTQSSYILRYSNITFCETCSKFMMQYGRCSQSRS